MRDTQPEAIERQRWRNLGRLLGLTLQAYGIGVLDRVRKRGFTDIANADSPLLRAMTLQPARITRLAERAAVTKQAMGQLVKDMEHRGYVVTEADPTDRRAKLVRYTPKGRRLLIALVRGGAAMERRFADAVGRTRLATLRVTLDTLLDRVYPNQRSFWQK